MPNGEAAELAIAGATLAMLVGAMLVLASLLRLGFVANFISDPVLAGFKSGIGLVIVVDQIPKLLGFHIEKTGFFRDILAMVQHLPQTSLRRWCLPGHAAADFRLGALRAACAGSAHRRRRGYCRLRSAWAAGRGGGNGGQHSPRPSDPWSGRNSISSRRCGRGAAGIALMSFTESIAAARAFARSSGAASGAEPGAAVRLAWPTFAGGLFGAMPAGGGTTQTAVNRRAGAHTQMAELVTAAAALATLVLLAPLIALMPNAVLAAVVVVYSVELDQPRRVSRDRPRAQDRILLGRHRLRRRGSARHTERDPGRGDRLAGSPRPTGIRSARLCDRSQTRDACLQAAVGGTSGRRDLARLADTANRGADVLRQRPTASGTRSGR